MLLSKTICIIDALAVLRTNTLFEFIILVDALRGCTRLRRIWPFCSAPVAVQKCRHFALAERGNGRRTKIP